MPEGQREGATTKGIFNALASDLGKGLIKSIIMEAASAEEEELLKPSISLAGQSLSFEWQRNLHV